DNTDVHSVYDPATNAWSSAPFLPEPRSGGTAVLHHDRILLMGGECDRGKPFAQNEADDLDGAGADALRTTWVLCRVRRSGSVRRRWQSELWRRNVGDLNGVHVAL